MDKTMKRKKKSLIKPAALSLALMLATGTLFIPAEKTLASEEEQQIRRAGILSDNDSEYFSYVAEGFMDALDEAYGKGSVIYAKQNIRTAASPATAAETLIGARSELIFCYGEKSLDAAASVTNSVPIIFGGVVDYSGALHLLPKSGNATGRNVSGIAGLSSPDNALSLLIEACGNRPGSVGILYDPADTDSILQNEVFESYLDEASIPWKEYEISKKKKNANTPANGSGSPVISVPLPVITAAASGKEGPNDEPDSIGDNGDLTGMNEPLSARSAKQSGLWKKSPATKASSFKKAANKAAKECDAIYLCAKNTLAENKADMTLLEKACLDNGTVTVGGDADIGEHTIVSLYQDPYDIGYSCGEYAVSVLDGEEEISELEIKSPDSSKTQKLFNRTLSNLMGLSWPKSFYEREDFLDDYRPETPEK